MPDHSDLPEVPEATGGVGTSTVSLDDVTEAMKDVVDPELGINVVDLGLVYGVHLDEDSNAVIDMTLTSAACPLTDVIQDQTNSALEGLVNDVLINAYCRCAPAPSASSLAACAGSRGCNAARGFHAAATPSARSAPRNRPGCAAPASRG